MPLSDYATIYFRNLALEEDRVWMNGIIEGLKQQNEKLRSALSELADPCWCGTGNSNPTFEGKHSGQCNTARDALEE